MSLLWTIFLWLAALFRLVYYFQFQHFFLQLLQLFQLHLLFLFLLSHLFQFFSLLFKFFPLFRGQFHSLLFCLSIDGKQTFGRFSSLLLWDFLYLFDWPWFGLISLGRVLLGLFVWRLFLDLLVFSRLVVVAFFRVPVLIGLGNLIFPGFVFLRWRVVLFGGLLGSGLNLFGLLFEFLSQGNLLNLFD